MSESPTTAPAPAPHRWTPALVAAVVVAVLAMLWWLSSVFVPVGLGLLLAYLLAPAVDRLQPKLGSRARAALLLIGGVLVLTLAAMAAATPILVREARHWVAAVAGEGTPEVAKRLESMQNYGAYLDPESDTWTVRELLVQAKQKGAPAGVLDALAQATPTSSNGELELSEALGDRDGDGWLDPGYGRRWRQLSRDRRTWLGSSIARLDKSGIPAEVDRWARTTFAKDRISKLVGGDTLSTAGDVGMRILGSVREAFATVGSLLLAAVLIPVYAFFFALALPRWRSRWPAYVPARSRALWQRVAHRIGNSIAGFLRGRVIVCLIVGLITAAGWWALGVRLGVLLGLATGALTLIPLASALAFVPVVVMGLIDVATDMHGWAWFAGVSAIYLVGQVADSVLNPIIVGDAVDLDMMTMIIALLAGGAAFGMIGLLIAVPAAATLRILADEVILPNWRAWASRDESSASAPPGDSPG